MHSDPLFHFENASNNHSDTTASLLVNEIKLNKDEYIPHISYTFEYGSSIDLRTDSFLSIERSLPVEKHRPSISSQVTLIDEDEYRAYRSASLSIASDLTQSKYSNYITNDFRVFYLAKLFLLNQILMLRLMF